MRVLYEIYRDWVCDGDALHRDRTQSGGWWAARDDVDAWIDPDGTLVIAGMND